MSEILERLYGIGDGVARFFDQLADWFKVVIDRIGDVLEDLGRLWDLVKQCYAYLPTELQTLFIALVALFTFWIALSLARDFL